MLKIHPDFRDLLTIFNSKHVRYLLLGGYAVNVHGHHRNTKDVDLWIEASSGNAQRVSDALHEFGFAQKSVPAKLFLSKSQVFSFGREPMRVDILTSPSGVDFEQCYARRAEVEVEGIRIPPISLQDLRANKRASGRTQDLSDLENLPDDNATTEKP